jgi:hypothetical protein
MTCIVGFLDKKNDCIWIGGDSLASNDWVKTTLGFSKVYHNDILKSVIFGNCGLVRHLDIMRYSEDLFPEIDVYKNTEIDHKYMVTKFIPRLYTLYSNGIYHEDTKNKGATFIIGVKNKVFKVDEAYGVLEPKNGICATGSGEEVAMGSLLTTVDMDIPVEKKIEMALTAAESYAVGVQRPFHIINTKDENVITIN